MLKINGVIFLVIFSRYSFVTTKHEYIFLKKPNCLEKRKMIINSIPCDVNVAIAAPRTPNSGRHNLPYIKT